MNAKVELRPVMIFDDPKHALSKTLKVDGIEYTLFELLVIVVLDGFFGVGDGSGGGGAGLV